jgi:hypothetical protein
MRHRGAFLLLLPLTALAATLGLGTGPAAVVQPPGDGANPKYHYPDFGFLPPPHQYEGRVFHLSQAYPQEQPPAGDVPEIATRDFDKVKAGWKQYLLDVRKYCFEGNVGAADVEDDWQVAKNPVRKWFHMPWQHFGPAGREGIHGMTKEAPVQSRQLAWTQTYTGGQTYAVGFYNAFGGYTIGRVFANKDHCGQEENPPASGKWENFKDIRFPVGTVVCKVLFVDVPPAQVPSLNPPLTWHGYITANFASQDRSIRTLSLIQMDIMVRHEKAPTGWVFGTFQYNGSRPGADPMKPWDNLVPVGLMWGNDPDVTDNSSNPNPVTTITNPKLKESAINDDPKELPPTHLGWNGRLNGPVDNPMSSCMSCHMTAETPQLSQISPLFQPTPPPPGSDEWMKWFQNVKCGEKFDKRATPTDFSLQMAMALQNFRTWRNEGSKLQAARYKSQPVPPRFMPAPTPPHALPLTDPDHPEVKIQRDYKP